MQPAVYTLKSDLKLKLNHADIHIGFELSAYTFAESDAELGDVDTVFLVKEFGALTEQTFQIVVTVNTHVTNGFQPATLLGLGNHSDYAISEAGQQNITLSLSPDQQRIPFTFRLFDDLIAEGTEAFQTLASLKEDSPSFSSPVLLSPNTVVVIEDDDGKLSIT